LIAASTGASSIVAGAGRVADNEWDFEKAFFFTQQTDSPAIPTTYQFLTVSTKLVSWHFNLFFLLAFEPP